MTLPDHLQDDLDRLERQLQATEKDVDLTEEEAAGIRALFEYRFNAPEEHVVPSTDENVFGLTEEGLDAALEWIDDDLEAAVVERWGSE